MHAHTTIMNAIDEYDVRSSFEALDIDHEGTLTFPDFYTLYLGLGFQPQRIPEQELRAKVAAATGGPIDRISIEECLTILSQFRRYREQESETAFQFLDTDSKGYLTASDISKLSAEVLGKAVPEKQAKRMAAFCSSDGRLDRQDFARLLSPPSP